MLPLRNWIVDNSDQPVAAITSKLTKKCTASSSRVHARKRALYVNALFIARTAPVVHQAAVFPHPRSLRSAQVYDFTVTSRRFVNPHEC